jgi:hypothetical protein
MIPNDIFVITPFSRDQFVSTSKCQELPEIPFTDYNVLVFTSRMSPFFDKYFRHPQRLKYQYDHFVMFDIPHQGKMITTLKFKTRNDDLIHLESQDIININNEIGTMSALNPNYFLFFSSETSKLPKPWVDSILPYFVFERTVYDFYKNPAIHRIPKMNTNGKIYLDLSDDFDYMDTIQILSSDFIRMLEQYYYMGTIGESEGVFVHRPNMLGDQVLDQMAGLDSSNLSPKTDDLIISEAVVDSIDSTEYATVYVLNFSKIGLDIDFTQTEIGTEFLVSLKKFLQADSVITKQISDSHFEVYVYKNGTYIESAINIKEMFGFRYFTDDPIGLLVVKDLGLLDSCKIIYDNYQKRGGVFVPMVHLDDVVSPYQLDMQLKNRMMNTDTYTFSSKIEKNIKKLGLKIVDRIDNYIFVEKNSLISKRDVYKSVKDGISKTQSLMSGNWRRDAVETPGPFDTLIVKLQPLDKLVQLIDKIESSYEMKSKTPRQF